MPTFKEHASAHCSVMIPFKKKRAANPCDYAPIAKALAETCMDAATIDTIRYGIGNCSREHIGSRWCEVEVKVSRVSAVLLAD